MLNLFISVSNGTPAVKCCYRLLKKTNKQKQIHDKNGTYITYKSG